MNKINRFEDILAWQRARALTREIYSCSRVGDFAKDFGLKDQIRRASVSTMSTIAEGFDRGRDKEFSQFLAYSKASCSEVKSQLYETLDEGYLTTATFENLYSTADEVGRLVSGFMNYFRQSQMRGRKFREDCS